MLCISSIDQRTSSAVWFSYSLLLLFNIRIKNCFKNYFQIYCISLRAMLEGSKLYYWPLERCICPWSTWKYSNICPHIYTCIMSKLVICKAKCSTLKLGITIIYHYSVYVMSFVIVNIQWQLIDYQVYKYTNFYCLNCLSSSNVDISIVVN